jgi:hypothetical protein
LCLTLAARAKNVNRCHNLAPKTTNVRQKEKETSRTTGSFGKQAVSSWAEVQLARSVVGLEPLAVGCERTFRFSYVARGEVRRSHSSPQSAPTRPRSSPPAFPFTLPARAFSRGPTRRPPPPLDATSSGLASSVPSPATSTHQVTPPLHFLPCETEHPNLSLIYLGTKPSTRTLT